VFSDTLLDHFQSPRNVGTMDDPDAVAEDENPVCGDRLRLWLRIKDDTILRAVWKAEGCAPVLAAASIMSEILVNMSLHDARRLNRQEISDALGGLPSRKAHAAQLCVSVLRKALEQAPTPP
jgi:nitrogen fixation NifU-like protein